MSGFANSTSVLIEWYMKYDGPYPPFSSATILEHWNNTFADNLSLVANNTTGLFTFRVSADVATTFPIPRSSGIYYYALLFDRTNNRKKIYENGQLIRNDAIGVNPDFTAAPTFFYSPGGPLPIKKTDIILRESVISAVPADIDDIIRRQWVSPMALHSDLQAVAVLASQWDFEDQIVDDGGHAYRTVEDHGVVGGYDLTSNVDLEDKIVIAEKCKPSRPPDTWYKFDAPHYAANWGFGGHGIQGGAHIIEALLPLYQYYNCPTSQNPIYIRDVTNTHYIAFRTIGSPVRYETRVEDASGARDYYIYKQLFDFDVVHVVIEGSTTRVFVDGQRVVLDTAGKAPDYSGVNAKVQLAGTLPGHTTMMRHWNYPAGSLPAGWEDELKKRVQSPWQRSPVFMDANLFLEYLLNSDIPDASPVIPNSANPGVGDLTITPAATFINSREVWRT